MRHFLIIATCLFYSLSIEAQNIKQSNFVSTKGLTFGIGIGLGALTLDQDEQDFKTSLSASLPNLYMGYRFNSKLSLSVLLPGATYKAEQKVRGFEAIMLAAKYSVLPRWFVFSGAGLTFDAPAFWTVEDFETATFNTGFPALCFGTGYKIWQEGEISLDIQYRIFVGQVNLPNEIMQQGISNMITLGFNWN